MSTSTNQTSSSTATQTPTQNCDLAYGAGDAAYAPALAYAMVAKLMGQELQLSNALKKMQADESTDAMKCAMNQAKGTRSSALVDSIGQGVAGGMSIAQGSAGIGAESILTGKRSSNRAQQAKLNEKIRTNNVETGMSVDPTLDKNESENNSLKDQVKELQAKHEDLHAQKDSIHGAVQGVGQFSQAVSKASAGIEKSNQDAKTALAQADQQSYKQVADELGSANQTALQTINQFTSENFAAATAIRG